MSRFHSIAVAIVLLSSALCHARDLAVVVNKTNSASQVTGVDLEKALKTGAQSWPNGAKIEVFVGDPDSADNRMILQRAFNLTPGELKTLGDAHKATIRVVGSDEVALTMVDGNPGAIAIVNVYSINSRVKVVRVDGKLPMEPGYLLHGN